MITHVVLFKLKNPTLDEVERLRALLMDMEGKIPTLRHIEAGVDVARSDRSYDLALLTGFDSMNDLDAYKKHPVHQQVINYIEEVKESVVCVDYES